tara:strand:+ start:157 stop:300 length:144 start_codon:yes stop_codon:yes gene_type:complete
MKKYLKTQADGAEPNNLLSLPRCKWASKHTASIPSKIGGSSSSLLAL